MSNKQPMTIEQLISEFVDMLNTANQERATVWVKHALQEYPQVANYLRMNGPQLMLLLSTLFPKLYQRLNDVDKAQRMVYQIQKQERLC